MADNVCLKSWLKLIKSVTDDKLVRVLAAKDEQCVYCDKLEGCSIYFKMAISQRDTMKMRKCRHCGEMIIPRQYGWIHKKTMISACGLLAEPVDDEHDRKDDIQKAPSQEEVPNTALPGTSS